MGAFKAYDIRGIYNKDFNKHDVYRIGFFLPQLLKSTKVLVGRDIRESSDEIFEALAHGITDAGADVYDLGLSTTPMVYWATANFGFDASVQITASHNPREYNGMKVSRTLAMPVGYDTGLGELEKLVRNTPVEPVIRRGTIHPFPVHSDYVDFIRGFMSDFSKLKIAIDCSNGMAAMLVKEFFGNAPAYIYDEMDGTFPNHEPNPLEEENVEDLKKLVVREKCDLGIIFDGDADRVMFVDEKGRFVRPDLMIALLGHYFKNKGRLGSVVMDIRSSKGVESYLNKLGFQCYLWRVGRAYATPKLRELDATFGGELAGHYYMKDFYYSDSAFLAVMLMLDVIATHHEQGMPFSQLIENINAGWANSGEVNFRIEQKAKAMEALRDHFNAIESPQVFLDFDGFRLEYASWWFNVRPSNTEPYLRFLAEATSHEILDQKLREVKEVLSRFQENE
ncbi:MAG: phosphomannomutase/phosphoglucomutase [Bacteroidales bacterium]|nr:phosphomannomutase/phosphoglucomutase [Bacteroidales bacterium]